jgi:hypothetical protein
MLDVICKKKKRTIRFLIPVSQRRISMCRARASRFQPVVPARRRDNSSLKHAELPRHHKARGSSIMWLDNASYIESVVSATACFCG